MNFCKLCPKVAWYMAPSSKGAQYFCGDHREHAVKICTTECRKNEREHYPERVGLYAQQQALRTQ